MRSVHKIKLLLMVGVFFGLSVVNVQLIQAQDADEEAATETSETTEAGENTRRDEAQATREARQAEREARLEQVDAARAERAATRCTGAQQKLSNAISRAETVLANRTTIYDRVAQKLSNVTSRLEAAEVDTSVLTVQIETFDTLVKEFYTEFASYQQALQDAAEIDCEADTEGFLLALEDARAMQTELKAKAQEISTQVKDVIVGTLNEIKDELTSSEDNDSGTTTEGEDA